jgi:hypothetical protein
MITVKRGVREDLGNWFSGRWILIRWWMMQVQVAVGACRENMTVGDWRRWCVRRRWCVCVKIFIPFFVFLFFFTFTLFLLFFSVTIT